METLDLRVIKEKRNKLKMSMQEMAETLEMKNASTYMKYENGTYAFKAQHLPILADALDCKISDFFSQKVAVLAT